jgi:uncharacterized membrane protein (DUF485 family)
MSNEHNRDELQALWQSMPAPQISISAAEMRERASAFERKVRRRNMIEYAAAGFVIVIFAWYATWPTPATPLWPIANVMIIIGTLVVVWNLHRLARARTTPASAPVETLLDFHRAGLVRQRDALRTVWLWYLAPFMPGLVLWFAALWVGTPSNMQTVKWGISLGASAAFAGLVFAAIAVLNLVGAARLGRLIDELDSHRE